MVKNCLYGLDDLFLKLLVILLLICHSIFPLITAFSTSFLKFMINIDFLNLVANLEALL